VRSATLASSKTPHIDRAAEVRLLSLRTTRRQRQFRDPVKLRDYYRGKSGGMTDAQLMPVRTPLENQLNIPSRTMADWSTLPHGTGAIGEPR